jgi:hypothetical protein
LVEEVALTTLAIGQIKEVAANDLRSADPVTIGNSDIEDVMEDILHSLGL